MFDLEYGERVVAGSVDRRDDSMVLLSRQQIAQLATMAKQAAEAEAKAWHEGEVIKLVAKIMERSGKAFSRFMSHLMGAAVAQTEAAAREIAVKHIAGYPYFMTCWEATDAARVATRWSGIAEKLHLFDHFDVPVDEFNTMRDWASRS